MRVSLRTGRILPMTKVAEDETDDMVVRSGYTGKVSTILKVPPSRSKKKDPLTVKKPYESNTTNKCRHREQAILANLA